MYIGLILFGKISLLQVFVILGYKTEIERFFHIKDLTCKSFRTVKFSIGSSICLNGIYSAMLGAVFGEKYDSFSYLRKYVLCFLRG